MKDKLFEKAISWTRRKGFKKIKANVDDFKTPTTFMNADRETSVTPDITAVMRGNKSYIEIALKKENKQALISKWKLYNRLAKMKGGKLYLLAARGHKAFTTRIVDDYKLLNAQVISI